MFCTKCGAKIEDGAKFCTSCGQPTEAAPAPAAAPATEAPAVTETPVVTETQAAPAAEKKDSAADILAQAKVFLAGAWDKTKEIAKKADEKLGEMLGDKKLYAYAGVIGLLGIIIVVAVIAGLIPESNGYLTVDSLVIMDAYDDVVYTMTEGKTVKIKTDAEDVDDFETSIDGKVTVFENDGTLYLLKGKKAKQIAEDVGDYSLSIYGDSVVYTVVDGTDVTYYYRKLSSSKSVEIHENELDSMILSYTISPDGKSVAYFCSDGLERSLYYFNGKKSVEVTDDCLGDVIGMSNGGKYIYAVAMDEDDRKITLFSYNKKGDETKIDSCDGTGFALNLDGTQIKYQSNGKTYISTKAKEPIKAASDPIELLVPRYTAVEYRITSKGAYIYPVENLYNHVYTSGSTAYYVAKKESKNVKLVKADSSRFTLDDSAEFLYYFEDEELMVLQISKGEKAKDKAKTIAKDVDSYVVTSDRKYVYFVSDSELHVVNGKKGGKSKELSTDDVKGSLSIDKNDVVYFFSDDGVYATTGKKKGKLVIDDAYFAETGGYVYMMDEDTLYAARGRSKPKKLIERD